MREKEKAEKLAAWTAHANCSGGEKVVQPSIIPDLLFSKTWTTASKETPQLSRVQAVARTRWGL